ncbi:MAG: hypothetical protein P4L85_01015 [Paludisphaera borealis]|uniref:hypothetical protein n=1 Tax=Paludisphaera borealis TaxID=1387353 RepID=UPI0028410859|nr:hypothetical protein [Paludisphaera borealis]MDR3617901.1 hypothetical protein [Paludisphaera borealis]
MFHQADLLLRGGFARDELSWRSRLAVVVVFGTFYGAVMGAYGGLDADRPWQMLYSGLKVPLLLTSAFLLSLPTFFVLNTLLGLRADFPRVVRALVSTQAGLTVVLASLAPITAFAYISGIGYQPAILFNALMFGTASVSAQSLLRREYRELIARNPAHRVMLRAWLVVYVFVGIQMGWVLRPFIGDPVRSVQFFREDSWSNAYIAVLNIAWGAVAGGR